MKPIIFSLVVFAIVCALIIRLRINWMKGIPDLSNKKVLEAIASRMTLDIIFATLFAWPIFLLPVNINIITMKWITSIFMAAIFIIFITIYVILRRKFLPPNNNKRVGNADINSA
ncbi:MAG: hypothetical protein P9X24_17215 [Candidatus Hatepunaea meridiana]|nr:hypothetical protein [Candidatus Hatepunaea meridiana]